MNKLLTTSIFVLLLSIQVFANPVIHRIQVSNLHKSGWHLAESTQSKFSVLLPNLFNDGTVNESTGTVHLLTSGSSNNQIKFLAMHAQNNCKHMINKFKEDLKKGHLEHREFYKNDALYGSTIISGRDGDGYSVSFRVLNKNGLYSLMISAPTTLISKVKEMENKFFNSLQIPGVNKVNGSLK